MRIRLVDSYTDPATGIKYGLRGDPTDFALGQQYNHDHVNQVTRDFVTKGQAAPVVAGFDQTLAGVLSLSVAAGRAYDAAGVFYETITDPAGQPAVVTLEQADPANPRIDLVYVLLEPGVQALPIPRTFRRTLTEAEIIARQPPYLPENFTRFSEEHAKASVRVRKGTAAAVPVAPAVQANEAPLFEVRVNAGAMTLVVGNVTDRRNKSRSLAEAWALIDGFTTNFQNLSETIDDRMNANTTVTENTGIQRTYNDAGNLFTWAGVAATQAAMGMMPAADKVKLDNATAAKTGDRLSMRDANGDINFRRLTATEGASPYSFSEPRAGQFEMHNASEATGVISVVSSTGNGNQTNRAGRFISRFPSGSNAGTAIGVDVLVEGLPTSAPTGANMTGVRSIANNNTLGAANRIAFYGEAQGGGGGSLWAGYFNGNVHVAGAFTKGSGNFLIDHPLDPHNKSLVHAFVESNRYGLSYYFVVALVAGSAEVDLDATLGFTLGTFAELAQQAEVVSVRSKGTHNVTSTDVLIGDEVGGVAPATITLTSANAGDTSEVVIHICAARKDNFIASDRWVDVNRRLVTEHVKPALTAADDEALEAVTVTVPEGHPLAGQTVDETVPALIGKQGFPFHPAAISGGGATPTRAVSYEVEE